VASLSRLFAGFVEAVRWYGDRFVHLLLICREVGQMLVMVYAKVIVGTVVEVFLQNFIQPG